MRSTRVLFSMMAVVSVLAVACSEDGSPSTAGGGAGSSGASGEAGGSSGSSAGGGRTTSASSSQAGGKSGGGSSSGSAAQAGSSASGGKSEAGGAGAGGTSKTGGTTSNTTTQPGTGGTSSSGGRTGTGTTGAGGQSSTATGGTSAGTGGTGTASTAKGGTAGGAGGTSAGGAGGTTSSGTTSTDVVKSAGCGKTPTLKGGKDAITIDGSRKYYLRIPDSYDNSHAYRLVFTFAESGSSAQSVMDRSYFRFAGFDPKNTVFVAPDAVGSSGSWSKTDLDFTDKILEQVSGDLCIDKTRLFASGFSFGGGMSIAIACNRADVFRAVAFWSGADLTNSCPSTLTKPIAYWASQASQDSSGTPSPTSGRTIQKRFAEVNGCTADPNAINFPAAGQPHTCTNYKNCTEGHPTIYCVFEGAHGWEPKDPGQSTSWAPKAAWDFITQF